MSEDFLQRKPPCDLTAECALLGAIIVQPSIFPALLNRIEAADFYEPRNQNLFLAMISLLQEDRPDTISEVVILMDALRRGANLAAFGTEEDASRYIAETAAESGAPSAAGHYARIIRERALLRAAGIEHSRLANLSFEANSASDYFAESQTELGKIYARQISDEPEPDALEEILDDSGSDYCPTGFRDFDAILNGGFRAGQLIVLAARPGRGKSALALSIAANFAKDDKPAVFYSLEMDRKELRRRLYFSDAGINLKPPQYLTDEERQRLLGVHYHLRDIRLSIRRHSDLKPLEIRAGAERLRAEWGGLSLIVVDYLGLMSPDDRRSQQSREQDVAAISRGLKNIAVQMNCAVLAVAQLNRQVEHRENSVPQLSDLRDSGAIEQDADVVAFISQPEASDPERLVTIRKQRAGAEGEFRLAFNPRQTRFADYAGDDVLGGAGVFEPNYFM